MSVSDELRRAALGAARDARELLAELTDGEPELATSVSRCVASLFAAEIGEPPKILDAFDTVMNALRTLSAENADDERIVRTLSRAMALLHPVRIELSRALGRLRDDPTAPFLLTSGRIKSGEVPLDDERRADGRFDLEVEVGLEGDSTFFTGRSGDLGRGGLFVATDDPLPVGTDVVLSFVLPDGYRVRAEGCVAWVRAPRYRPNELPAGMGIRFEDLADRDAHAISFFLKIRPAFRYGD